MGLMHLNFDNKPRALHFWKTGFILLKMYFREFRTTRDIEDSLKIIIDKYCHTMIALDQGHEKALEELKGDSKKDKTVLK